MTKARLHTCCASPARGEYLCVECGCVTCFAHAALWTDTRRRCRRCFSPTVEVGVPDPMFHAMKNPFREGSRIALVVVDGLYIAGAQRHCLELLRIFKERQYWCVVLALEGGGLWYEQFFGRSDCVIIPDDAHRTWNHIQHLLPAESLAFVSSHLTYPVRWATAQIPSPIPLYAHLHSEPSEHEAISSEELRSVLARSQRVFVPSDATRQRYVQVLEGFDGQRGTEKLRCFANAIPFGWKRRPGDANEGGRAHGALRVGVVSRLDRDKFATELFIGSLKELAAGGIDAEVRVAGEGEMSMEVRRAVADSGLGEMVTFLGFVQDIENVYRWSDVVFLPSKREGMPYVFLESAALGRPLVAPSLGVFSIAAARDGVLLFPPGDAKAAARAICDARGLNDFNHAKSGDVQDCEQWGETVVREYGLQ